MNFILSLFSIGVAFASAETDAKLNKTLSNINSLIINPLISFLFALAVIFFLWGMFQFLANAENEENRTTGKSHMLWGVIGITIMLGVWTILSIVMNTFSITGINPKDNTVNLQPYTPPSPNNLNQN